MPTTALKHLAKRAGVKLSRAEHLWDKAGDIVSAEYDVDKSDSSYWALRMGITKRMLGLSENKMTLKMFLEGAYDEQPNYQELEVQEAIDFLNSRCKNALWMLEKNRPLYRGHSARLSDFTVVDTSKTQRVSENTSNFYTLILDNNPQCKDFPKRGRSFIGSTDDTKASQYGICFIMIPTDGAKIGVVNKKDIWDAKVKLFNKSHYIEDLNRFFESLGLRDTDINSFYKFDAALKSGDSYSVNKFYENARNYFSFTYLANNKAHLKFLESVYEAYSPRNTGFTWYYTSDMPRDMSDSEVWVSGEIVTISQKMWKKLRVEIKRRGNL